MREEALMEPNKPSIEEYNDSGNGKHSHVENKANKDSYFSTKPISLAKQIIEEYDVIYYGGQLWYNKNGCYRLADMELRNYLQERLGDEFSSNKVKQVLYALQSRVYKEMFAPETCWINFRNGVYNWVEDSFHLHGDRNDVKFMNQIPVDFNKEAKCPMIETFLSEVITPEDKGVLLQFLGYCMIPTTKLEKAMMLIGEGANGKSTFLKVMTAMIGQENISNLSLFDLEKRFRLVGIVGKLVNIYPDLPNKNLVEIGIFKAVVSGDPLTGERKYGTAFSFNPYAKMLFSTNKLPTTQDISPAFFRRWLIIEFPNTFNGKQRDPGLLTKLSSREELEGLVQLSIRGLNELYSDEEFSESHKMNELIDNYEKANNPVSVFINERCVVGDGFEIKKTDLYATFKKFTFREGLQTLGRNDFARRVRKLIPSITEISDTSRRWRGIKLDK